MASYAIVFGANPSLLYYPAKHISSGIKINKQ